MDTIVGVFRTRVAAAQALNGLLGNGVPQQSIIFLTGDQSQAEIASVPTTDAESDGMGKSLGSLCEMSLRPRYHSAASQRVRGRLILLNRH